jgi:hypothetical protein
MNWHLLTEDGYSAGPFDSYRDAVDRAQHKRDSTARPTRYRSGWYELGSLYIVSETLYRSYFIPFGSHMLPEGPERHEAEANEDDTPCGYCGATEGYTYHGGHSERCCRSCNGC